MFSKKSLPIVLVFLVAGILFTFNTSGIGNPPDKYEMILQQVTDMLEVAHFNPKKVDEVIEISEEESREMTKRLAKEEGVFSGMSGGGAVAASLKLAKTLTKGTIVTIIPDRGDRYLSSNLFE